MKSSTILITGGTGYIGAYIGLFFAQKGFRIILLDPSPLRSCQNPWANSIDGDYGDSGLLHSIFKAHDIDMVIHCGAFNENASCLDYYHYDLINTIKLLEQVRGHGIKKFIFTSSASIYGNNSEIIDRDSAKEPNNSRGKCTQLIESMLVDYAENKEFFYAILRLFCTAGEIPDHKLVYSYSSYNRVIMALIESVITNKPFYYYDTQNQTPDGSSIHDYAHVWDIARAHFATYEYITQHERSDHFNIGSNKGVSVKQLIGITEKLFNKKIKTIACKSKLAESPRMIADISKAVDLLGWQPSYSEIEFILKTTFYRFTRN